LSSEASPQAARGQLAHRARQPLDRRDGLTADHPGRDRGGDDGQGQADQDDVEWSQQALEDLVANGGLEEVQLLVLAERHRHQAQPGGRTHQALGTLGGERREHRSERTCLDALLEGEPQALQVGHVPGLLDGALAVADRSQQEARVRRHERAQVLDVGEALDPGGQDAVHHRTGRTFEVALERALDELAPQEDRAADQAGLEQGEHQHEPERQLEAQRATPGRLARDPVAHGASASPKR
jgi:hypothetical protein